MLAESREVLEEVYNGERNRRHLCHTRKEHSVVLEAPSHGNECRKKPSNNVMRNHFTQGATEAR